MAGVSKKLRQKDVRVQNGKYKISWGKYNGKECKTPGCHHKARLKGYCKSCYLKNWKANKK